MSRCVLDDEDRGFEVVVGWDPGIGSFFAQARRKRDPEGEYLVLMGRGERDYRDPDPLIDAIAPYACKVDLDALKTQLLADQANDDGSRIYSDIEVNGDDTEEIDEVEGASDEAETGSVLRDASPSDEQNTDYKNEEYFVFADSLGFDHVTKHMIESSALDFLPEPVTTIGASIGPGFLTAIKMRGSDGRHFVLVREATQAEISNLSGEDEDDYED